MVGAGFAGLCAAEKLKHAGRSVVVLEARDRIGGRTEAGKVAGIDIDLGGMWVGPTQTALLELASRFKIETYPTWLAGRMKGRVADRVIEAQGEAFENEIGLISKVRLGLTLAKINRLLKHIDASAPWESEWAARYDRETVASWAAREIGDVTVRGIIDFVVRSVFCAEPDELSLLFFLFYLKSAGGLEVLIQAGPGGAQNHLFLGGLHQLAARLVDSCGLEVTLSEPVEQILQTEDEVRVRTGRSEYRSRHAVVAVPPPLVSRIAFEPPLPVERRELLKRQTMGACIKVWVAYATPFWRDRGLNGSVVDDSQPFSPVFDVTPPNTSAGLLAGFFDAEPAARWSDRTGEARREVVLQVLVDAFGEEAAHPIDFRERDWTKERWSHGCYGAFMPPGALSRYGHTLRQPHGRVHWAGTETAERWSGYVEGAIRSGYRAAEEILTLM